MKDLSTRAASAVVFAAVMLAGMLWNFYSFIILFGLINVICLVEFSQLTGKILRQEKNRMLVYSIINSLAGTMLYLLMLSFFFYHGHRKLFVAFLFGLPALYLVKEVLDKKSHSVLNAGAALLSFAYITLPLAILCSVSFTYKDIFESNELINQYMGLAILVLIWVNDTMAYFSGRLFGKHKLYESLSPKKTWEGFFGGMIFTIAAAFIFHHFKLIKGHWYDQVAIGILASVAGTIGDLFESMMKRQAGVKDSGRIMPGHGGLLDRFDAFLFAIPAVCIYLLYRGIF